MKKPKLVTREWLREKLVTAKSPSYVIGRALIAIYERQTSEEQSSARTRVRNGVGFTGTDAKLGTKCAKAALAGELKPWMVEIWSSVTRTGFPKICKYTRQLNEIALTKSPTGRLTGWQPAQQILKSTVLHSYIEQAIRADYDSDFFH